MELQDGINKFLTELADNQELQQKVSDDPEGAVKSILGSDLQENDLLGLVKGTGKLFGDKANGTGFLSLLKVKECIPGLAELLTQKGGLSVLTKYLGGAMNGAKAPVQDLGIITQLLSSKDGISALGKLIGQKGNLPDLSSMMAMMSGAGAAAAEGEAGKDKGKTQNLLDAIGSIFGM